MMSRPPPAGGAARRYRFGSDRPAAAEVLLACHGHRRARRGGLPGGGDARWSGDIDLRRQEQDGGAHWLFLYESAARGAALASETRAARPGVRQSADVSRKTYFFTLIRCGGGTLIACDRVRL